MFVRKKTYENHINQLQNEIDSLHEILDEANRDIVENKDALKKERENSEHLFNHSKVLEQRIHDYQVELDHKEEIYSSENSVTLRITDDLTQVVPTIKVKPDVFEKMVELGYLDDSVNSETKSVSMQAALLVIANEAMEQIIESMSNSIDNPE